VAPEVIKNESYTESADVYSFGVIMWEVVARQPPFHGLQTMQIAYAVANQGLRPTIPSTCPPSLAALITDCWQTDPRHRPTFAVILERLNSVHV